MQKDKFYSQLVHLWSVHTEKCLITQKCYNLDQFWHQIYQIWAHFIRKLEAGQAKTPK